LRFCDVDFGAGAATGIPPLLKVRNRSPAGWCELLRGICAPTLCPPQTLPRPRQCWSRTRTG